MKKKIQRISSPQQIKLNERGLIPAIVQDRKKGDILMLAYMNREAISKTFSTGNSHFWSRSRQRLWMKGETSGNVQKVREVFLDCDGDTLLLKVDQKGVACHTGKPSCFFTPLRKSMFKGKKAISEKGGVEENQRWIFEEVERVIQDRKRNPRRGSYVSSLFEGGQDRILKKVTEEAGELIIGSKNKNRGEIICEMADLWFHCLVVLGFHGISLSELNREMEKRFGKTNLKKGDPSLFQPAKKVGLRPKKKSGKFR